MAISAEMKQSIQPIWSLVVVLDCQSMSLLFGFLSSSIETLPSSQIHNAKARTIWRPIAQNLVPQSELHQIQNNYIDIQKL